MPSRPCSPSQKKIRVMISPEKNEKTVPPPLTQFIASTPTDAGGERRCTEDISGTDNASTVDEISAFLSSCNVAKLRSLC